MYQKTKKNNKSLLAIILTLLMFALTACTNKAGDSKAVSADNKGEAKKTVTTKIEKDKVYVSLKEAFEYVGGKCTVDGKNATATSEKDTIKVNSESKEAYVNSTKVEMKDMPKAEKDDIYVPMEFLNEALDAKVTYDEENKTLDIRKEMPLKYSKGFSVKYLKGGLKKVIDGDKRTLILVPKGKEVPEEYKNEIIINTPMNNVLAASTIQGCLLRAIQEIPSITAVTTKEDQWEVSEVADAMKSGKIKYVGENTAPDYEKISSLKPSMAFVYSGDYGLQPMMKKLDELKVKYAVSNEYLEEDPLGRMEWIKFIAAFYDKEDLAEKYFDDAVKKVEDTTKKIANDKKPKVSWGIVYNGKVYVAKPDSYVGKMIEMAGGDYIFKNENVGNGTVTLEEFYAKSKDADILIYSSLNQYSPTLKSVIEQAPILEKIKPVMDKKVWCFHPDYYQSVDKTDELITDLAAIFHADSYKDYNTKHYIRYTK